MDAFFASVEQLDHPDLQGKCLVVGGKSNRGVVAAASYEARKYGIHSAMPIFQARQKCSELVIVPPRRRRYVELSNRIMALLGSFSPLVEPVSIDEAYVDITGCRRMFGPPEKMASTIKMKIKEDTKLTCSIGVAPNKFLAKIASDVKKPDGLTVIFPDDVTQFIETLPIGKVPGVGQRADGMLRQLGIHALGQVRAIPLQTLVRQFGKFGYRLFDLAQGKDDSPVVPVHTVKSVSSENTLEKDTCEKTQLAGHLLAQSQLVARQLRQHGLVARTVTLKLKTADFQRRSYAQTSDAPVRSSDAIYGIAMKLLEKIEISKAVRLIGIAASGLQPDTMPVQQPLFGTTEDSQNQKWEQVDSVMDAVAQRFGHRFVSRGSLVENNKKPDRQ